MSDIALDFRIQAQPDNVSCGPTCLQAVYRHFGQERSVQRLIREIDQLQDGGTLAVILGQHALRLGFRSTIYTFDLKVFDPSWFASRFSLEFHREGTARADNMEAGELIERLKLQKKHKKSVKLQMASQAYIDYLQAGGRILMEDLSFDFIVAHLKRDQPILTGLSSTYLYHCHREHGDNLDADDVRGLNQGHFVVLTGYNQRQRSVTVSDPYLPNPSRKQVYKVPFDRLAAAIFLGVLTYDANLLVIEPKTAKKG